MKPRTVLLYFTIVCCGGTFFLEQPGSSLMSEYDRFKFLTKKVRVPQLHKACAFSHGSYIEPITSGLQG